MGSGHILVYAFDVLIQLYIAEGFRERDAVELILRDNLYGLDIDKRAFQLAYFALMMKARQYSRRILNKHIKLNVYKVPGEAGINESDIKLLPMNFPNQEKAFEDLETLVTNFKYGSDLGSLIEFKYIDFENLKSGLNTENISLFDDDIRKMVCVGELLQQKYDIAVTNPPYMGSSGMNKVLSTFVKKFFPNSKSDLFGVFIERLEKMVKLSGYYSMITQHAWMFLASFEKLRNKINKQTIINMLHLGTRAFEEIGGEVVQTTTFVMSPVNYQNYIGSYVRLVNFENHKLKEEKALEAIKKEKTDYLYTTVQNNFTKIPGQPISYWVSENVFQLYDENSFVSSVGSAVKGIDTGNNNYFLKYWFEINKNKTSFLGKQHKWFPYNKGGKFRRWYGNREYLINYENNGYELKNFSKSNLRNKNKYLLPSLSWSTVTSSRLSVRANESGFLFDNGGSSYFSDEVHLIKVLALLNSRVAENLLQLSPTLNFQPGDIGKVIYLLKIDNNNTIDTFAKTNIELVKKDWDSFETSWDFTRHPLI